MITGDLGSNGAGTLAKMMMTQFARYIPISAWDGLINYTILVILSMVHYDLLSD